ncbi:acetylornithine deacetylase (ArgE) [Rhizobium rhizosphaerae]|uniref:Acetylornithine deacetylase (ArgE) n=1 Tax=Xaviernesmea rhizosphaerae TaxID=1672749 RepID=A0A1Q9ADP8_9HYPH|nr:acetylornithine deacetylase [Xaviernesmea rhizosphaerae]OLP53041.1 acetylornithine deacetylase (ArgE) [Xaviernesmea rhizosphaerae]
MNATEILEKLVSFPSVVGTPNAEIVAWIRAYLAAQGVAVTVLPGPEGDRSNLFATIGPVDVPGYILSGHMDVVPAEPSEWSCAPFQLKRDGERLTGRGTTDMKGYLATVLAAVPQLVAARLQQPIHIAFSYDEEAGCRGVPHLLARLPDLCAPPLGAIIGEPSNMRAVLAHKGKAAARVSLRGRAGHSSRPDLGLNAIHAMADVLNAAVEQAAALAQGPFDAAFEPRYSSLQAGVVAGGKALNIIPDLCTLELEARAIAGIDPAGLLAPVRARAEALQAQGFQVEWTVMSAYPALALGPDRPLAGLVAALSGQTPLGAVSYGTEAGLYQAAGVDAVICGPGDIGRAHKPDEFILESELAACQRFIEALGARCAA